ncbi:hypothetical protein GCM10029992_65620 [Glycomyces albus]
MIAPTREACPIMSLTVDEGAERGLRLLFTAYLDQGSVSIETTGPRLGIVGVVTGIGEATRHVLQLELDEAYADRLGYTARPLRDAAEHFYLGAAADLVSLRMIGEFNLTDGRCYRLYAGPGAHAASIRRIAPGTESRKRVAATGLNTKQPHFTFPPNWSASDRRTTRAAISRSWLRAQLRPPGDQE